MSAPDRSTHSPLAKAIASSGRILTGAADDYDYLLDLIGDSRFVLLGEASHGTHEFYHERARITQRLITEKGFAAVAVEADWPDAYRVNRYVRGCSDDVNSEQALAGFKRFPTWMWRNADVVAFVDWLREHNAAALPGALPVGFYGLDLYSLFSSIEEVLHYLDQVDPEAARRARQRYACFDHFGEDSQRYGYLTGFGMAPSCEDAVVAQLSELASQGSTYSQEDGPTAADAYFHAQQNARLVLNAENYYRTMFRGRISSWNLRDQHMADTLDALAQHLTTTSGRATKIVVWEHNSHIGDARATEVGRQGEWTVGQLARERYGEQTFLVGLTTHHGTVTAASEWDAPAERKRVRAALDGSYEHTFHHAGIERFCISLEPASPAASLLSQPRLERAIGVIYLPESERQSHYFYAHLPTQFDAIIHIDETRAIEPLELTGEWKTGEAPETYPVGV